jgi:hypothetical protein
MSFQIGNQESSIKSARAADSLLGYVLFVVMVIRYIEMQFHNNNKIIIISKLAKGNFQHKSKSRADKRKFKKPTKQVILRFFMIIDHIE